MLSGVEEQLLSVPQEIPVKETRAGSCVLNRLGRPEGKAVVCTVLVLTVKQKDDQSGKTQPQLQLPYAPRENLDQGCPDSVLGGRFPTCFDPLSASAYLTIWLMMSSPSLCNSSITREVNNAGRRSLWTVFGHPWSRVLAPGRQDTNGATFGESSKTITWMKQALTFPTKRG